MMKRGNSNNQIVNNNNHVVAFSVPSNNDVEQQQQQQQPPQQHGEQQQQQPVVMIPPSPRSSPVTSSSSLSRNDSLNDLKFDNQYSSSPSSSSPSSSSLLSSSPSSTTSSGKSGRNKAASVFGGLGGLKVFSNMKKTFTSESEHLVHLGERPNRQKRHMTTLSNSSNSSTGSSNSSNSIPITTLFNLNHNHTASASASVMNGVDTSSPLSSSPRSSNSPFSLSPRSSSPRGVAQQTLLSVEEATIQQQQPVIIRTFVNRYDEEEAQGIVFNALVKYQRRQHFFKFLKNDAYLREQRLRRSTIKELYFTEVSYISVLELGYREYYKPLAQSASNSSGSNGSGASGNSSDSKRPLLDNGEDDIRIIFSNMDQVINMNKQLAQDVLLDAKERTSSLLRSDDTNSNWSKHYGKVEENQICWLYCHVGQIFDRYSPFLKIYTTFVNDFDASNSRVDWLTNNNPKFFKFMEAALEKSQKSLNSILITIIQRIPRYELLFKDLLKRTDPDHPDFKFIESALVKINNQALFINEKKREYENESFYIKLQSSLGSSYRYTQLLQPGRQYIRQWQVHVLCRRRDLNHICICYLCNDMLLIVPQLSAENIDIEVGGTDSSDGQKKKMARKKGPSSYQQLIQVLFFAFSRVKQSRNSYMISSTTQFELSENMMISDVNASSAEVRTFKLDSWYENSLYTYRFTSNTAFECTEFYECVQEQVIQLRKKLQKKLSNLNLPKSLSDEVFSELMQDSVPSTSATSTTSSEVNVSVTNTTDGEQGSPSSGNSVLITADASDLTGMEAKRVKLYNRVNALQKRLTMTQYEHATLKSNISETSHGIRWAKEQVLRLEKQIKADTETLNQLNASLSESDELCGQLVGKNENVKRALSELDRVILYKILNEDVEAFFEVFNKEPTCELNETIQSVLNQRKLYLQRKQQQQNEEAKTSSHVEQSEPQSQLGQSLSTETLSSKQSQQNSRKDNLGRSKTLAMTSGVSIPQNSGYKSTLPPLPCLAPPSTTTAATSSQAISPRNPTTKVTSSPTVSITTPVVSAAPVSIPVEAAAVDIIPPTSVSPIATPVNTSPVANHNNYGSIPPQQLSSRMRRTRVPVRTKSTILRDDPYFKFVQNQINEQLKLQEQLLKQEEGLESSYRGEEYLKMQANALYCLQPPPSFKWIQGEVLVNKYLSDRLQYGEDTTFTVPDREDELFNKNIDMRAGVSNNMDYQFSSSSSRNSMNKSSSVQSDTPVDVYDEFDPLMWHETELPDDPVLLKAMIGKLRTSCLAWKNRYMAEQLSPPLSKTVPSSSVQDE